MKPIFFPLGAAALLAALALPSVVTPADAGQRYTEAPPVVVSPDLSAPWVLQLRRAPVRRYQPGEPLPPRSAYTGLPEGRLPQPVLRRAAPAERPGTRNAPDARPDMRPDMRNAYLAPAAPGQRPKVVPMYTEKEMRRRMNPEFLPRDVSYQGPQAPGTVVVDTKAKFLYLVQEGGKARRYGVGVGKEGFGWSGTNPITRKAEWPGWTPPAEMIKREAAKGRVLPAHMEGGPDNPLGARALYLGDTLYRIHGTNAPWTIGQNVSSGCIRMRNEDVVDLYERVGVGTKVVVM